MSKPVSVPFINQSPVPGEIGCVTGILQEGWDGRTCYVHVRAASDGKGRILMTGQRMDVRGDDFFEAIETNFSTDGGKTWSGFRIAEGLQPKITECERIAACDMTPLYHKKTGKFIAAGHTAMYDPGALVPIKEKERYHRVTPYAVFDEEKGTFGSVKRIEMPDSVKYRDCGSGCSQCYEEETGNLLIPISFCETVNGKAQDAKVSVMRCSFDGETLCCMEIGNDLEVPGEVRGIGEASVTFYRGRYYLTIRGDTYGYVSVSEDGIHYTQPAIWHYSDGEIVPTYNTQSHWLRCGDGLYLVYTRRNGHNDHVFRHRAPLYAAKMDAETVTLLRETEFVVIPERGARLGNFGVCTDGKDRAIITVTEWMQPEGCEIYGSNNALWFSVVSKPDSQ